MRPALLLSLPLLLAAQAVSAQSVIGRILEDASGRPIATADVRLIDRAGAVRASSVSDTAGWFRLVAPIPGRYTVRASALGYVSTQTVALDADEGVELSVEVRLSTDALPLEPLRVVAKRTYRVGRLAEYYNRAEWSRKTGFGKVFMRDELERSKPTTLMNIVRMYPQRLRCQPLYLIDGLPVAERDIDVINPEDVEGIEIYRGVNEVPVEYAHRSACGLVMVWSRIDATGGRPFSWKRLLMGAAAAGFLILLMTR